MPRIRFSFLRRISLASVARNSSSRSTRAVTTRSRLSDCDEPSNSPRQVELAAIAVAALALALSGGHEIVDVALRGNRGLPGG